jgi:UDP-N-acetylmuramyl pentapeptide phosphotransferase/UDP-N-acetylglucosamine-1-phosphate transferase
MSQQLVWLAISAVCFAISLCATIVLMRWPRRIQATQVTVVPLLHADGTPLTAGELEPGQVVAYDPKTGVISLVERLNAAKLDRPASASDKRA